MGWTKHRSTIEAFRKTRSSSLANLKRLANLIRIDLRADQIDYELVREFHSSLRAVAKLGFALSLYEPDLTPYFDLLLEVTNEWVIGLPYDDRVSC